MVVKHTFIDVARKVSSSVELQKHCVVLIM